MEPNVIVDVMAEGDDVIDMTSTERRTLYNSTTKAGGGIATVYGEEGNDVILGSDGKVYGGDGNDTIISHCSTEMWGGNGADVFGFISNPASSKYGDELAPMHTIHDFQSGVDKIKLYSASTDTTAKSITKTGDGDLQWQYTRIQGSLSPTSGTMTVKMNDAAWSQSDIEFVSYQADVFSGGTSFL